MTSLEGAQVCTRKAATVPWNSIFLQRFATHILRNLVQQTFISSLVFVFVFYVLAAGNYIHAETRSENCRYTLPPLREALLRNNKLQDSTAEYAK